MRITLKSIFSINPVSLTIGVVLIVAALFFSGAPILDLIELKTLDLRFLSRGSLQPSPVVAIALIDEKSLDTEGRWPWPRSKIASLVDILSADGARVIAFDIGFLEPDENSQLSIINEFDNTINALGIESQELGYYINESKKNADNDKALAEAIKKSSATIILGYFFHMSEADLDYRIDQEEINRQLARISKSKYPFIIYEDPEMTFSPFIKAYAPESNLKLLTEVAEASGFFSVASDADGVIRWMPMIIQCGEDMFPHLTVASVWNYLGKPQLMVNVAPYGLTGISMGPWFIPTDENGQFLINYLGPPKTFPHISISDILRNRFPEGTFKNRIVLVGATAMGTHDLRSTPFSPLYPGVEIHATAIDNILTQDYITKPRWSSVYDLLAIVILGLVTGIVLPRISALKGFLFAAGLFILHIFLTRWLFTHYRVWLNVVYPLLVLSLNYTALTVYHYVTEERERKKIKGTFRHYVAPLVVEEMLKDPNRLKLGGEEKVLTVLFCDLQGFTSYSERYAPHEMVTFLSEYFARMSEEVFNHWGTLKEYVGDELMAIFGAPIEHEDHAERACNAALAMREQLRALREEWSKIGRPPLRARTGINSGPMLIGNLGSKYRFAYGALGDQVNLGSRLEGLNKHYKTEILIGENTARLVKDAFHLREIDSVQVVGKQECVVVYELLERADKSLDKTEEQVVSAYAAGYEAYCSQHWDEAMALFGRALEARPDDGPSLTMTERCRMYKEAPPPEDWDCVYVPTTK